MYLDLLRSISAQLVVVGHGISFCNIFIYLQKPHFPWIQNIAVLIFFLLSGFLISYSITNRLAREENYSFGLYFIDRFSRIYTAFLPAILLVFIVDSICIAIAPEQYEFTEAFNLKTVIGNIFMLQDYPVFKFMSGNVAILQDFSFYKAFESNFSITSFGSARPFWTLAIEWWIYIWFGYFILKIMRYKGLSAINIFIFLFLSIVPGYNIIAGRGHGLTTFWLFGVLIFLLFQKRQRINVSNYHKAFIIIFLLILACIRISIVMNGFDPIFAFLIAGCLFISIDLFSGIEVSKTATKIIRFSANYSYTLYLIHYSIYILLVKIFSDDIDPYILFSFGFMASNLIAAIVGYFTEMKATKLIRNKLRTYYSRLHAF